MQIHIQGVGFDEVRISAYMRTVHAMPSSCSGLCLIRWCTSESESEISADILKNEMAKIQNSKKSAEDDCSPSPKKVKTDDSF